MFRNMDVLSLVYTAIALLSAIIPHEVAHGYAAYLLGDDTAKNDGRLSFNPINHIDPVGLLSMILLRFGWAKAVPINSNKFKNRRKGTLIVSLAGVTVNFIIGFIAAIIMVPVYMKNMSVTNLIQEIMWYNVMLGVFNLIPIPPLDGSKALASILPMDLEMFFYKYEKAFYLLLIALLFSGSISKFMGPIIINIINIFIDVGISLWNII